MTTKLENTPLTEIFKPFSFKPYQTAVHGPMPIVGSRCYIWLEHYKGSPTVELEEMVSKHRKWKVGHPSTNMYIELSDKVYETFLCHCINQGPNTSSLTQTVRIWTLPSGVLKVIAEGWGHSHVVLFEGDYKVFTQYMREHQVAEMEQVVG